MELVFERFVHRGLLDMKARGELASVSYQSNRYYLLDRMEEGRNSKSFNLRPDLVARTNEGKLWILDAKWKLLDERALDGKSGICQSDLYQLLSYATIYRGELANVDRLILVYPEWSGFSVPIRFEYADSPRTPLHVIAAPLDKGKEWSLLLR